MGLDIYFYKIKESSRRKGEEEIDDSDLVDGDIGHFRKVNFLIPFFYYEEDCLYKKFDTVVLKDLKDRCERVLSDHSLAEDILPTEPGFFFGSTDYDEWYYRDVEQVLEWCNKTLSSSDEDDWFVIYCWW